MLKVYWWHIRSPDLLQRVRDPRTGNKFFHVIEQQDFELPGLLVACTLGIALRRHMSQQSRLSPGLVYSTVYPGAETWPGLTQSNQNDPNKSKSGELSLAYFEGS